MAPPPATMESFWKRVKRKSAYLSTLDRRRDTNKPSCTRPPTLMALRTIMMASCSDRSVSSVNCSAPPLRMMVHVFAFGQPLKKLYLQTDIVAVSQSEPGPPFGRSLFDLVCLASLRRPGPLQRARTVPGHRPSSHSPTSGWSRRKPGVHTSHAISPVHAHVNARTFPTSAVIGLEMQM